MLRSLTISALGACIFAVACGHGAPPPKPPPGTTHATPDAGVAVAGDAPTGIDSDLADLAKRSVKLYADLAKALADTVPGMGTNPNNCVAATARIKSLAVAYAEVTEANARVLHAGHERVKQLKAALAPYEAELDASAKQIAESPTMRSCSEDPGFGKAMDLLVGEP